MNTLKVGDLVKRTSKGFPEYGIVEGNVYTVLDVKDSEEDEYADICLEEDPERWYDKRNFKLYTLEPTNDLQSELEEALAKIESLESALEDAVKRIDNWRNGRNEGHGLNGEEFTVITAVNQEEGKLEQFKPISEMTREDWELAEEGDWVFETREGKHILVVAMTAPPLENYAFRASNHYYYTCKGLVFPKSEDEGDIIKRIK